MFIALKPLQPERSKATGPTRSQPLPAFMLMRVGRVTAPSPSSRKASSMASIASAMETLAQTSSCLSNSIVSAPPCRIIRRARRSARAGDGAADASRKEQGLGSHPPRSEGYSAPRHLRVCRVWLSPNGDQAPHPKIIAQEAPLESEYLGHQAGRRRLLPLAIASSITNTLSIGLRSVFTSTWWDDSSGPRGANSSF